MGTVKTWPPCIWQRVLRSRKLTWDRTTHGMMMMLVYRWQPRRLTAHLILLTFSLLCCSHNLVGSGLIGGMIQQSTNIVHEKRIEQLCNLLLVCKFQGSLIWYPVTCQI